MNLKDKSILITGGTGSLGKALTKYIFLHHPDVKKWLFIQEMNKSNFKWHKNFLRKNILRLDFL